MPSREPPEPARVSDDGTIVIGRLPLDRRVWDVLTATGKKLFEMAEQTSAVGLFASRAGPH